jgi:hypothetical protein
MVLVAVFSIVAFLVTEWVRRPARQSAETASVATQTAAEEVGARVVPSDPHATKPLQPGRAN